MQAKYILTLKATAPTARDKNASASFLPLKSAKGAKGAKGAKRALQPQATTEKQSKKSFTYYTPLTGVEAQVYRVDPGRTTPDPSIIYGFEVVPGDALICKSALTQNPVRDAIEAIVPMFKAALAEKFPDFPIEEFDSLAASNLALKSVTGSYYFALDDEAAAFQRMIDFASHAKVVLDGGRRLSETQRKISTSTSARVLSDSANRDAIVLLLSESAKAEIRLGRKRADMPDTLHRLDANMRERVADKMASLLCINVTVELENYHSVTDWTSRLPTDYRQWLHAVMPNDPFAMIYETFYWGLFLNLPLAAGAPDLAVRNLLGRETRDALDFYLAGNDIMGHEAVKNTMKKFRDVRRELLTVAHIDPLLPIAFHGLNLSADLGEMLHYAKRFNPGSDEDLMPYTLAKETLPKASQALSSSMAKNQRKG